MSEEKCQITGDNETITITKSEYGELIEAKKNYQWLLEQLTIMRNKQFGSKSEKTPEQLTAQLNLIFNEAELCADTAEDEKTAAETEVKAHKRVHNTRNVRDILPENIEVVEVEHNLPEAKRLCPQCGETMGPIGKEVQEKLKIIPAKAILYRDVYYTYACENCNKNDVSTPIVKTPKEAVLIPGSFASAEAVAHIAVQKFVMGSPLYRQEQEWNRQGVMLSRQTMSNWLLYCSDNWLSPIFRIMKEKLNQCDLLHADETELQVLHEEKQKTTHKSYMWLYRTSGDALHPIILYDYAPGRGHEYPNKFLKDFHGYLQTDGYSGYHGLEGVTHIGCWAHARRKFYEAYISSPKGIRSPTAEHGMNYCTKLFDLEQEFNTLSPEDRKKQRLERAKPVLDELFAWLNTRKASPKSALGQALNYLKNQWTYLNNYLLDGRIELSNNRAERSIKPFVISRKNFLFANTARGAESSAVLFSLIETAKENGLDPNRYLTWALTEAPRLSQQDTGWAARLVPWNAPENCRVSL